MYKLASKIVFILVVTGGASRSKEMCKVKKEIEPEQIYTELRYPTNSYFLGLPKDIKELIYPYSVDMTELYWQCSENRLSLVQKLLKDGEDVNCVWKYDNSTPLYIAAKKGHQKIVEVLIKKGADAKKANSKGETPLQMASQGGFAEIVDLIISTGANDKNDIEESLKRVVNMPYPAVIKLLLEQYLPHASAPCRHLLGRILIKAAEKGYSEIVDLVLRRHGSNDQEGSDREHALTLAAQNGHVAVVALLLKKTPINKNVSDSKARTPLYWAVLNGHIDVVGLLLNAGAQIDKADEAKRTPLWVAANSGHVEIVKLLAYSGASLDARDCFLQTPLFAAASGGHLSIVTLLAQLDADLNLPDKRDQTPLFVAAQSGYLEIVSVLLDHGAIKDLKYREGQARQILPVREVTLRLLHLYLIIQEEE